MMEMLSPLDYPRQSLANLGRGGYRLLSGQGQLSDALGMIPGLGGAAAGLMSMNPLVGLGVGAGLQGVGKLSGLEGFDAPTTQDVLGAVGGDPESTMQNVLAHLATDPMMYAGAYGGARAASRFMRPSSALAEALETNRATDAMSMLGDAQGFVPKPNIDPEVLARLAKGIDPMGGFPTSVPLNASMGEAEYQAAVRAAMMQDVAAGEAGGALPEAAMPQAGPPMPGAAPPMMQGGYSPAAAARQGYRGQVGIMNDAMHDMLGKGFANPAERLEVAGIGQDALSTARDMGIGHFRGAAPLTPQELAALHMRGSLAESESAAMNFIPMESPAIAEGTDLLKLMETSADQMGYGALNSPMPSIPQLMRRGIGPVGNQQGALAEVLADSVANGTPMPEVGRARAYAKAIADARLASPEMRLADQLNSEMTGMIEGAMSPEQTAAAVQRARQYGLPIEGRPVLENYAQQLPRNLRRQLNDFHEGLFRGAPENYYQGEEGAGMLAQMEAQRNVAGGELLRLLGPQGMQRLATAGPQAMVNAAGTADKTSSSLTRALAEALQARGLYAG